MYTITLEDYPSSLTKQAKLNAEYRFQRVLKRSLGEPEDIILAYKTWQNAMETDESELLDDDKALAKKWMDVVGKAQMEGLKELGEGEAYFEIRVEK